MAWVLRDLKADVFGFEDEAYYTGRWYMYSYVKYAIMTGKVERAFRYSTKEKALAAALKNGYPNIALLYPVEVKGVRANCVRLKKGLLQL